MPYNANIPQATDQLSNSQPQILANFQSLAPFGNQTALFMTDTLAVTPVTAANQFAFFVNDVTAVPQIFIQPPSVAAPINITSSDRSASQGGTTLPSGIILKWGINTTSGAGTVNITFTVAFPTAVLSAQVTTKSTGGAITNEFARLGSVGTASITVKGSSLTAPTVGSAIGFYFFVIGY